MLGARAGLRETETWRGKGWGSERFRGSEEIGCGGARWRKCERSKCVWVLMELAFGGGEGGRVCVRERGSNRGGLGVVSSMLGEAGSLFGAAESIETWKI